MKGCVGLSLDLALYEKNSFKIAMQRRIGQEDASYRTISERWSSALKTAFQQLPDFPD